MFATFTQVQNWAAAPSTAKAAKALVLPCNEETSSTEVVRVPKTPQAAPPKIPLELLDRIQRRTEAETSVTMLGLERKSSTLPTCAHLRERLLTMDIHRSAFPTAKADLLTLYKTRLHTVNALASHTQSGSHSLETGLPVKSLVFSRNEAQLVTADTGHVHIWNLRQRPPRAVPLAPGTVCHPVSLSRDGNVLLTGTLTGGLWFWDMGGKRPKPITYLEQQGAALKKVRLSHNADRLLTLTEGHIARVWNLFDGVFQPALSVNDTWAAALSPDGKLLATATRTGAITLQDVEGRTRPLHMADHCEVWSMAFSHDGSTLATGHRDGFIYLWDSNDGELKIRLGKPDMAVCSLEFAPNGRRLVSGDTTGSARVWDTHRPSESPGVLQEHSNYVSCVSLSPDGRFIATASKDSTVRLWDSKHTTWLDSIMSRLRWW